jgi:hypothetical protein
MTTICHISHSFRPRFRVFPWVPGDSLERAFAVELQDESVGGFNLPKTKAPEWIIAFSIVWPVISKNPDRDLPIQYNPVAVFGRLNERASSMKQYIVALD